jgi:DNA-binding MarR family transcriptional regulator
LGDPEIGGPKSQRAILILFIFKIDPRAKRKAITTERLTDDMELELLGLFPKHSDLRLEGVQLLMHLEESGPQKQSELAKSLGIEPYSLSRLLTKLEHSRYVTRTREATDKIVSLRKQA